MKLFVPNQLCETEARVSLVPATAKKIISPTLEVALESGAGLKSGHPDASYTAVGVQICGTEGWAQAEIVFVVRPPAPEQVRQMKRGALLVGMLSPYKNAELISACASAGVSAMALEYLPRITRAQGMDTLSSQANLAGYKAVIMAAERSRKIFPMLMTAAGTIQSSKVFIIGVGVAGLQAIATAKRLGAQVSAYDVRPAVKEQVQSVGAKFIELPLDTSASATSGGYAKELTPEQQAAQRELMASVVIESDIVITTAAIPGKPAPRLIPASVVEKMRPGSIIVDLASETGGNCELTESGRIVEKHGVTLIGTLNIPSTVPFHASQVYASNLVNILKTLLTKEGALKLDLADEIVSGVLLTHEGAIVHPRHKTA